MQNNLTYVASSVSSANKLITLSTKTTLHVLLCTHFDPINPDIQARRKDVKSVQKWDQNVSIRVCA